MTDQIQPYLTVRVDPADMVRSSEDPVIAQAARLRWAALKRAFGDRRVSSWNLSRRPDQIHVPAALIAAAGVSPLVVAGDDQVEFDIPTLLDATLELCEPLGHA